MSPLVAIWVIALVLIGLSTAWMSALIVLRLVNTRLAARRTAARNRLMRALVEILTGASVGAAELAAFVARPELTAEVLIEMQGLVRGDGRDTAHMRLEEAGVLEALRRRSAKGSRSGRVICLEALAGFPSSRAAAAMRRALDQPDLEIRLAGWRGLAATGAEVPFARLMDELASGALPPSRVVAEILREAVLAAPEAAGAALSRHDLSVWLRAALITALAASGDYRCLPELQLAARHPAPEVRAAAAGAVGRLQHPMLETALSEALTDETWMVRAAAAEAAGLAGFGALRAQLAQLLDDPQWLVRFRAGEALARLGPQGVEALRTLARSGPPQARRIAELALAEAPAA